MIDSPDARSLPEEALQVLRKQAHRLRHNNKKTWREIAGLVGVGLSTVMNWVAKYNLNDSSITDFAAKKRGRSCGEKRILDGATESLLREMIVKERPADLGIPFGLWSQAAVREAIRIRCGIEMSPRTVYSYLERWGYTSQRPAKMAIERDAEWVQLWMKHEFPAIQARVAAENGILYWADETAVQQGASWAKGYSPKGETPILEMTKKNIGRISMVCASSNEGIAKFSFKEGGFNWQAFKEFLEFLVKDQTDGKKIFIILDNASIHNATAIHDWLEQPDIRQKIELFYIPPYSPDCNPQELINNSLKTKIRSSPPVSRLGDLLKIAHNFMKDLARNPMKIKSHFNPFMTVSLKAMATQT